MHTSSEHDHVHGPGDSEHCWYRGGPFAEELTSHLPFSVLSVVGGLILAGLICFAVPPDSLREAEQAIGKFNSASAHQHATHEADDDHDDHGHASDNHPISGYLILFHLFHPAHMLFSAAATAAMFWRYERNWFKAILVGLSGAIVVCGISDILMPQASAMIMGHKLALHLCIVEHPMLVIPFAVIGVLLGLAASGTDKIGSTVFSHSLHVGASTMASIFYLIGAFSPLEWINQIGTVFFFICLAVMIPCCLSDIVYPLLFTRKARSEFAHAGHCHHH